MTNSISILITIKCQYKPINDRYIDLLTICTRKKNTTKSHYSTLFRAPYSSVTYSNNM